MRIIGIIAAAAAAAAALGSAQAQSGRDAPQSPPVISMPMPPMLSIPAPAPPAWRPPADPNDAYVRASGQYTIDGINTRVDFLDRGETAQLRFRDLPNGFYTYFDFHEPVDLVRILADTRFAALWPAIEAWAGADLGRGAAKMLARAEAALDDRWSPVAARNTAESSVGPRAQLLLQANAMLQAVGRRAEADAMLREALVPRKDSGIDRVDRMMLALRRDNSLANENRAAGIRALSRDEKAAGKSPYAVNFQINRAAYLAESRRYAEALATITAAERAYAKQSGQEGSGKVAGSDRQFTWIRACALKGLGRAREAAPLIAALTAAPEAWDSDFVTAANFDIRFRAAFCLKDREMAVREVLGELETPALGTVLWTWLQPGIRPLSRDRAMLASVRGDPRVQAAIRGRMRVLPAAMIPALNAWRNSPPPPRLR